MHPSLERELQNGWLLDFIFHKEIYSHLELIEVITTRGQDHGN